MVLPHPHSLVYSAKASGFPEREQFPAHYDVTVGLKYYGRFQVWLGICSNNNVIGDLISPPQVPITHAHVWRVEQRLSIVSQ